MVDEEVENILREIRERVRAQELPVSAMASSAVADDGESSIPSRDVVGSSAAEALARIESYLTTTSRAWNRLPPLVSNRSGGIARLELWIKRQIKRATHWFTWEQVNFNASVHHALQDALAAQRATQSGYGLALENVRAEIEGQQSDHERALELLRAEMTAAQSNYLQAWERRSAEMNLQIEAQAVDRKQELAARVSDITKEVRERNERMLEEQRVCFKQLSLEATEAAVLEDRTRRKTEALLEELQRRLNQLEKGKQ